MKLFHNTGKRLYWTTTSFAILGVLLATDHTRSQSLEVATAPSAQITTQERIEIEEWWPTASNRPLDGFAGSASCVRCHGQGAPSNLSSMRRASITATDFSPHENNGTWKVSFERFNYSIVPNSSGLEYSVSNGQHDLSRKLDWVMGAGDLGRTFLYQTDGRWYQSNMSFYTRPSALDVTTGLHVNAFASLPAALGTLLSPADARSCFGCHTVHATSPAGFNPAHAEAGLGCEACHGPAKEHVDQMSDASRMAKKEILMPQTAAASVYNPAKLSPADSIDFCGACHRSFADAALSTGPGAGTAVVRFQPYRLEESKCWRSTKDARLTCVACHDPHEPLNRDDASYDRQCIACHAVSTKAAAGAHSGMECPKATSRCVTCHMPKVALASMHGEFTDHFIRIVHPGEPLPK